MTVPVGHIRFDLAVLLDVGDDQDGAGTRHSQKHHQRETHSETEIKQEVYHFGPPPGGRLSYRLILDSNVRVGPGQTKGLGTGDVGRHPRKGNQELRLSAPSSRRCCPLTLSEAYLPRASPKPSILDGPVGHCTATAGHQGSHAVARRHHTASSSTW